MSRYDAREIEPKWQQAWDDAGLFRAVRDPSRPKYYVLEMFPYPSGRIHIGHTRNYTMGDVIARYKSASGFNVLHPMGFDAFGMPAENAAIEMGVHPGTWTYQNIATMRAQMQPMGFSIDWSRQFATCDPEYYGQQQALFLDMLDAGLVTRKAAVVNWDPVDMTVLANEQVIDGRGWRSGAAVERRELVQWFFRITDMAEELLDAIDGLDAWPDKVRTMQRNWIGKSRGLQFGFETRGAPEGFETLEVYTTRPDTLLGASFAAIAPDHPLARALESDPAVAAFVAECRHAGTSEEAIETAEKKGIDTGIRVVHPFDPDWELPVWIANFILMDYGTGAIFGCPAHDQRDLDFARQYGLPVIDVFAPVGSDARVGTEAYVPPKSEPVDYLKPVAGSGVMTGDAALDLAIARCEADGVGAGVTRFRLRDWGISRQRYWGCPIPVIHCAGCGTVPEARANLPVRLPEDVTLRQARQPARAASDLGRHHLPALRGQGPARDRHHGHLRRLVLVLRPLHRAAGARADLDARRRLLDERRPVYRRRRARDPAPALLAVLRPGDDADRPSAREGDRAVRGAVHPGHGDPRDLRDPHSRRPHDLARPDGGDPRRDRRAAEGRRAGRDRPAGEDVEVEEERRRPRRHHRPVRRGHRPLVRDVRQPARARRRMDRRRRRGRPPPPRPGLAARPRGGGDRRRRHRRRISCAPPTGRSAT